MRFEIELFTHLRHHFIKLLTKKIHHIKLKKKTQKVFLLTIMNIFSCDKTKMLFIAKGFLKIILPASDDP